MLSIWGLGTCLVSQVPCFDDAIAWFGFLKSPRAVLEESNCKIALFCSGSIFTSCGTLEFDGCPSRIKEWGNVEEIWKDANPRPLDHEAWALPLCYNHCPKRYKSCFLTKREKAAEMVTIEKLRRSPPRTRKRFWYKSWSIAKKRRIIRGSNFFSGQFVPVAKKTNHGTK